MVKIVIGHKKSHPYQVIESSNMRGEWQGVEKVRNGIEPDHVKFRSLLVKLYVHKIVECCRASAFTKRTRLIWTKELVRYIQQKLAMFVHVCFLL